MLTKLFTFGNSCVCVYLGFVWMTKKGLSLNLHIVYSFETISYDGKQQ